MSKLDTNKVNYLLSLLPCYSFLPRMIRHFLRYLTQDYLINKGQKSSHQITTNVQNIIIAQTVGACKQKKGGNSFVFPHFSFVYLMMSVKRSN